MQRNGEKKLDIFFHAYPTKTFKKRFIIVGGSEEEKGLMYITQGYVRQYILSAEGEEQTTIIFGPSDIFPLIWVLPGKERKYRYFESLTPVVVKSCPRKAFTHFIQTDPSISYMILEQTLFRYDELLQRMAYISLSAKAQTKIVVFLLLLSKRFGDKDQKYLLPFPLTHKDIASCLGLTRETVSIAIKKLLDTNIIIHKGHFLGVDIHKKIRIEQYQLDDILR